MKKNCINLQNQLVTKNDVEIITEENANLFMFQVILIEMILEKCMIG